MEVDDPKVDLSFAGEVIRMEARCIGDLAGALGEPFAAAARRVYGCEGTVILTGIGKAGIIARKISATLASTGTPSIFLHPVEALHGDLGRVRRDDVLVALSHSGATEEIVRLVDHLKARGAYLVAITAMAETPLGEYADIALCYGDVDEACPLGLAPTVSTSCMLALGDALALTVMKMREFSPEEFAAFHPGGELGRGLMKVEEAFTFRKGESLPLARHDQTVRQALSDARKIKRRAGAVLIVDDDGRLVGILTDADLRRQLLEKDPGEVMDSVIARVMHPDPKRIRAGELASKALAIQNRYRIDELPVVDADDRPVGLLDVQDMVALKALNHGRH